MLSFLLLNVMTNATPDRMIPAGSHTMILYSPDGQETVRVLSYKFYLNMNGTKIEGRICNGFAGEVQYVNSSVMRGSEVLFTSMLCGGLAGPQIMEVENAFQEGLKNGMILYEKGEVLTLQDMRTNSTFVYGKSP